MVRFTSPVKSFSSPSIGIFIAPAMNDHVCNIALNFLWLHSVVIVADLANEMKAVYPHKSVCRINDGTSRNYLKRRLSLQRLRPLLISSKKKKKKKDSLDAWLPVSCSLLFFFY